MGRLARRLRSTRPGTSPLRRANSFSGQPSCSREVPCAIAATSWRATSAGASLATFSSALRASTAGVLNGVRVARGETLLASSFEIGPGGKGSNQSVASAMAGAETHFISRLGKDAFADIARATWDKAGVAQSITEDGESYTGAAYIFLENATGNNAIIVAPGAAGRISVADIDARRDLITGAKVFITQLEQPIPAARHALELARAAGVRTILNPAPAAELDDAEEDAPEPVPAASARPATPPPRPAPGTGPG